MPISPNQGATSGGALVTITGTNLTGTTSVHFGSHPATSVTNVSPTQVTAVSPAGFGAVGVSVTTLGGTSNPIPFFYLQSPFVASISSSSGSTAGGETVTLSGVNLATATSVSFGANTATPTVIDDGSISVVVPAGAAGPVSVIVTTAGGIDWLPDSYTYIAAPTVSIVSPTTGPTAGGTLVSLAGTGLSTTTQVTFDGTPANFSVISDTLVSANTPPGTAGAVDVVVTNPAGSATAVGGFSYIAGPGI
jgi:hypothetical protein